MIGVRRGTELYPRIFGFDVKVFTNCRFGMMYWALVSYTAHEESFDDRCLGLCQP